MAENLIIIGAGGGSREIASVVEDINAVGPRWYVLGFLDDDLTKHGQVINGLPVLGPLNKVADYPDACFIVGIANAGDPLVRRGVVERLNLPAERYATIIHPSASVSKHAVIGAGTAIMPQVVVTTNTRVGRHVILGQTACLSHDGIIEDYVTIAPGAVISGFVRIEQGAYIGAGATLLPRLNIGPGAIVGIGSVVLQSVLPQATVFGNPARMLPRR